MASRILRFNYRVLTVFVIVALPMLLIGSLLVLGTGQARLRDSYGLHLTQVAEHTSAAVDLYVYRRILDVALLGRVPEVVTQAVASSRLPLDPAVVREHDRVWTQERRVPDALGGLLNSPASRFLADVVRHDPIYRELLLTDRHGRLIAASNVTSDYYQGDEDWWQQSLTDGGSGRVSVTDVRWDDSAGVYALEIAVPVEDPSTSAPAGILKAVADVRELLAVVAGIQVGLTGEAALIREDGSFVFGRRITDPKARFFATDLLRERLQMARELGVGVLPYFAARASDGRDNLIGVALSQLRASYPNLPWLVAVSQSEEELLAPVRAQIWNLVLLLSCTAVVVLGLALWFSMRLASPLAAVDMHLVEHATVPRLEGGDERA